MRISIATCLNIPEPDEDQLPLLDALADRGVDVSLDAWDDPASQERLEGADMVLLRSTWNYYLDPAGFQAWADKMGHRLMNPPTVVRGNLHKAYLQALTERGVGVIPTRWVSQGEPADLEAIAAEEGWGAVVVKPSISAGSWSTKVYRDGVTDEAQRFLAEMSAQRDMMVQRYMPSVAAGLEKCLCWFDGGFSHAVAKQPRYAGQDESVAPVPISPQELEFARRIIEPLAPELLYGRVDLIPDDDGTILLSELELIEPSLFLLHGEGVLDRFADHVVRSAARMKELSR